MLLWLVVFLHICYLRTNKQSLKFLNPTGSPHSPLSTVCFWLLRFSCKMVYVLHNSPSTNLFFFGMFSKLLEKYEFCKIPSKCQCTNQWDSTYHFQLFVIHLECCNTSGLNIPGAASCMPCALCLPVLRQLCSNSRDHPTSEPLTWHVGMLSGKSLGV